jgi:hypothetical protein
MTMADIPPNYPELLGTAEVAELLDSTKSRITQMLRDGILPTPIVTLASGPVWDAEAIEQFAKTWDRQGGRVRPLKHRYVELTYRLPGDRTEHWMAVLTEAGSPKDALVKAIAEVKAQHPEARRIEEFMQRTITPKKARAIAVQFTDGTWPGWNFRDSRVA